MGTWRGWTGQSSLFAQVFSELPFCVFTFLCLMGYPQLESNRGLVLRKISHTAREHQVGDPTMTSPHPDQQFRLEQEYAASPTDQVLDPQNVLSFPSCASTILLGPRGRRFISWPCWRIQECSVSHSFSFYPHYLPLNDVFPLHGDMIRPSLFHLRANLGRLPRSHQVWKLFNVCSLLDWPSIAGKLMVNTQSCANCPENLGPNSQELERGTRTQFISFHWGLGQVRGQWRVSSGLWWSPDLTIYNQHLSVYQRGCFKQQLTQQMWTWSQQIFEHNWIRPTDGWALLGLLKKQGEASPGGVFGERNNTASTKG